VSSPGITNPDQSMVNLILKLLHSLTEDPNTVLHCSIAGGRKTMSIYFAYALQFFGREHDRLYHVLVHPDEFQNHPEFYYIPPNPEILETADGREISTENASIDMIEIPFIRLGAKREYIFGDKWLLTYEEMVRLTQAKIEQLPDLPQLIIDVKRNKVSIGLRKIHLSPIELATYYYYAERSKSRQDTVPIKDYEQYFEAADGYYFQSDGLKRIIDIYRNLVSAGTYDNFIRSLDNGNLPFERACQHFSRIKRKIRHALQNDDLAEYYVISAVGTYRKSYGIKLDKSKIILR
ncbi:MAG: TIGR02584 family CRISPR-associated protein, partial [Candidatus Lokiarchaeota archaeon]|nr:TIGR02584 family CRISPR-associated protein [Candidatus Lokiarchaeota archaeon]